MASVPIIDSPFLVLRTSTYAESSIIVAGLTPEQGQVHFLVRGGKRMGAKTFPLVDLFRLLQVQYRDTGRELLHPRKIELIADHGDVARHLTAYHTAGWLARFALLNVPAGLEHPRLFQAIRLGFARLAAIHRHPASARAQADAVLVGTCLIYLHEGGWLDEQRMSPREANQCRALLAMAVGEGTAPKLKAENWRLLREWILGRLRAIDCQVPESVDDQQERQ